MADQSQKYGIHTGVITNGLLLTPERYDALYTSGVRYFNILLDTIDPVIYRLLRGVPLERVLKNLLSASQKIQTNCLPIYTSHINRMEVSHKDLPFPIQIQQTQQEVFAILQACQLMTWQFIVHP